MARICGGCGDFMPEGHALCNGCWDDKEIITKTVKYMNKVLAKLDKAIEESRK